ncbi:aldose 1-epimerase [Acrasis kona]|uniref:Aldose 1-epimerase n=1 Tax=Acrasis kona TaxID=1008807 RepID=A0AAW2Z470_9EUKA
MIKILVLVFLCTLSAVCAARPTVQKKLFGTHKGKPVYSYNLVNSDSSSVKILDYGGIITNLYTKDRYGKLGDIVLGFDNIQDYETKSPYFGALVGRYANRIAKGTFELDGVKYKLAINNPPNSLHGGLVGFDKRIWDVKRVISEEDSVGLELTLTSADMEEGFPGQLEVTVIYLLNNKNELSIEYKATTNKKTVINLTNHSYFNLAAGKAKNVLNHTVVIDADRFTIVDETQIPTGENRKVENTPFDFRKGQLIGDYIWTVKGGYDHNFCLNNPGTLHQVATVKEEISGRVLKVSTDQPGMQFYSGNFLDGSYKGKDSIVYVQHYGFAMETQHYPDSPNQREFPTTVLEPGQVYQTKTVYAW